MASYGSNPWRRFGTRFGTRFVHTRARSCSNRRSGIVNPSQVIRRRVDLPASSAYRSAHEAGSQSWCGSSSVWYCLVHHRPTGAYERGSCEGVGMCHQLAFSSVQVLQFRIGCPHGLKASFNWLVRVREDVAWVTDEVLLRSAPMKNKVCGRLDYRNLG